MTVYNNISEVIDIKDCYMLDTNVLVFIHGFETTNSNQKKYSKIVDKIIEARKTIYFDSISLSEFINVYINKKLGQKTHNSSNKFHKRRHRNTPEYNEIIEELNIIIKQMKISYKFIDNGYDIDDFDASILNNMEFPDYMISCIAKQNKAVLITEDKDFNCLNTKIDILFQ